jgi:hypothetical protein
LHPYHKNSNRTIANSGKNAYKRNSSPSSSISVKTLQRNHLSKRKGPKTAPTNPIPTIESGQYEDLLEFFKIQTNSDNGSESEDDYSPANIYGFESYNLSDLDDLDLELDQAFATL